MGMGWLVSGALHVSACACIYQRLSVYLHALRAGHVSAARVNSWACICMCWHISSAERVCMRLHVLWSACVSLCPEVIVHFHVLACNKGWVCIFMCLHVSEGWAWFAHIKSLTLMYFHSSSHIQSSMSVPLHVLVYVNIIKLARMKRHACVCARLHVLKLGTHLHFWGADAWLLSAVPVQPTTAAYSGTRRNMSRINGLFAEAGVPRAKPYPDLEKRTRTHLDWWIYLF